MPKLTTFYSVVLGWIFLSQIVNKIQVIPQVMLLKYVVVEVIIATKVVVCGSTVATDETLVSQALASLLGHLTQLTKAIYHQTWRALPG